MCVLLGPSRKVYVFTHWNYVYVQCTLTINTVKPSLIRQPTGHKTWSYLRVLKFKKVLSRLRQSNFRSTGLTYMETVSRRARCKWTFVVLLTNWLLERNGNLEPRQLFSRIASATFCCKRNLWLRQIIFRIVQMERSVCFIFYFYFLS